MLVAMVCSCGASLELQGTNDTYTMLMSSRFADAHVGCGFLTPTVQERPSQGKSAPSAISFDDED